MVSDSKAHGTEAADHLGSSEARQFLSRLSGAFGVGGVLIVHKSDPGPEGADLAPSNYSSAIGKWWRSSRHLTYRPSKRRTG